MLWGLKRGSILTFVATVNPKVFVFYWWSLSNNYLIPLGRCKIISVLLTMMLNSRGTAWSLRKAMTSLERQLFLRIQTVTMFNNHGWRNVTKRIRNFGVFYKQLFPVLTLHCEHLYWFDWKCKKYAWSCRKTGMFAGKPLVFWEWLVY